MSHVVSFRFWRINIILKIFLPFYIVLQENYIAIIIVIELSPSPNAARIFCMTHGLACSWRNGDAQSCKLDLAAFSPKKALSDLVSGPVQINILEERAGYSLKGTRFSHYFISITLYDNRNCKLYQ